MATAVMSFHIRDPSSKLPQMWPFLWSKLGYAPPTPGNDQRVGLVEFNVLPIARGRDRSTAPAARVQTLKANVVPRRNAKTVPARPPTEAALHARRQLAQIV